MTGFLPFSRGTLMLDVIALALALVVPVLIWSIVEVKWRRNYRRHKTIQLGLGILLLVVVAAFELEVRLFSDWRSLARPSPYFETVLFPVLYTHVAIAVMTTVLWVVVTVKALRQFPNPPMPNQHSEFHRPLAWLAALGMVLTAMSGWLFYWMAFVASSAG